MKQSYMLLLFSSIYYAQAMTIIGSLEMGAICFVSALWLMWKGETK